MELVDKRKKYFVKAGQKEAGTIQNRIWVGYHDIDPALDLDSDAFSAGYSLEGMTIRRRKDNFSFTIQEVHSD
ncbi:hypothetical protein [Bowmanella pacifica]|uniref:Uncharacterized protein n=1 Tax=Bowmanella pacifica TaxID=502051 RepID=A0A918DGV2_9ALTE|nr:hypothetical protein [Bowmanella pacifica]GGO66259.1 hypothetical protein GCM10010982_10030 [Bowmanella pacifica]